MSKKYVFNKKFIVLSFLICALVAPDIRAEKAPLERVGKAVKAAVKVFNAADDASPSPAVDEKVDQPELQKKAKKAAASDAHDDEKIAEQGASATKQHSSEQEHFDVEAGIPAARPQSDEEYVVKRVLQADVAMTINPGSKRFMRKTILEAERRGFDMVVFRLDTPGGLLDSTRDIVKTFMAAKIPIAVFVGPSGARAASAGTFITMAAQVAAMAPGTNIGAAHPVTVGAGDDGKQSDNAKHLAVKAEEDTAAFIEGIATQRRRNIVWARKAVIKSVSIVSKRALELGVIDLVVRDVDELLQNADGLSVEIDGQWKTLRSKGALIEHKQMSTADSLVNLFSNPNISYLLFMAGLIGIAMEFYHPGVFFPGVMGGISLILAFISFQLVPINIGGLLLILLGSALLVAEAFLPSFGVLGIGGAAALALGGTLLVDDMNPNLWADPGYGISPWTLWPTIFVVLALLGLVGRMVWNTRQRKPVTGRRGMVGLEAVALTDIGPAGGRAQLGPEIWSAFSAKPIARGQGVRVLKVDGLKLEVEGLEVEGLQPDLVAQLSADEDLQSDT